MLKPPRHVLVLAGPTASGKTPVSLLLASRLNGQIISADSRQIYKFMDIGTAKPSIDDRKKIKHYFVDELMPDEDFNAGEFGKKGRLVIDKIFHARKTPLIVGGSGLYIQALIDGFFEGPPADPSLRKHLHDRLKIEGPDILLQELKGIDPAAASRMLPSNVRRIIRALEIYELTGVPISRLQQERTPFHFIPCIAGLEWDRRVLYERINLRTDWMMKQGLKQEVERLQELGYRRDLNALQTVGYKEMFDYLHHDIGYDRMVELIKQNSRRYAKRQLTWFRRDQRIRWFKVDDEGDFPDVAEKIVQYFLEKNIA